MTKSPDDIAVQIITHLKIITAYIPNYYRRPIKKASKGQKSDMIYNRIMSGSTPVALINGMDNFVAKLLAVQLLGKDIQVVGIGEMGNRGETGKNFEWKQNVEAVHERVQYVFDFVGEEQIWEKARADEAKLAVIRVNVFDGEAWWKKLWGREGDWRLIEIIDAYGPGMERDYWLSRTFEAAVRNQKLELPAVNLELRLVSGDDAVEAILRGTLMSGTQGERFMVAGAVTQCSQVADALYHGAKMTKKVVAERMDFYKEWNKSVVEDNWEKLRWKPESDLKQAINKTLQYFFTVVDEETRNKKNTEKKQPVGAKKFGGWEVEVEADKADVGEERSEKKHSFAVEVVDEKQEEKIVDDRSWIVEKQKQEELQKTQEQEREWKIQEEVEKRLKEKEEENQRKLDEERQKEREIEAAKLAAAQEKIKEAEKREEEIREKEEVEEEDEVVGRSFKSEPTYEWQNFRVKSGGLPQKQEVADPVVQEEIKEIEEVEKPVNRSRLKQVHKKPIIHINWGWLGIGVSFGILLLASVPLYEIWKTSQIIKRAEQFPQLMEQKKYDVASKNAVTDLASVKAMEGTIDDMGLKAFEVTRNYYNGLKVIEGGLELEQEGLGLVTSGEKISGAVFGDKEIDWGKETKILDGALANFEAKAGVLQARLGGDWSWLPGKWHNYPAKGADQLNQIRNLVSLARRSLDFVPTMIGADGSKKDYLVLLQNEMELRPGGGFIGSYAILSFDSGALTNFTVSDVYEADGQLKGHVEPPEEIKNYLGEASWYMRDANWQPNFVASAKDIQWFFEKETGRKVDGVIGVDLAVAKELLKVTGEVYVPDFKEKINKDNLYEQAEFYSENKSFPGSQQKENFLGGLGKQLFEEVKNMKPVQRLEMVNSLVDLLERNEIQLAMNDTAVASKIAPMGWDGGLYEGRCGGDNCFTDYFYAVEANLGVNKANYFLSRNMEMQVDITNQAVSRVVKINYENTAKSNNWPGGDYKNYLRVYLPAGANLAQVAVYDTGDPSSKKIFNTDELKVSQAGSKKMVGLLVTVPITKKRTVELRYTNQIDITNKDAFSYMSYIQRQPGYGDTAMVNLVSFPDGWQPVQVQPAASLVGGKLLFNQKFDRDMKMGVEIGK